MARPIELVLMAAAIAVAFALGRGSAPAPTGSPSAAASSPERAAIREPARDEPSPALRSMVCAAVRRPPAADTSCDELDLRRRWCEAELAECSRQRATVRHPWPEGETVESPERWSATLDEAFEACGIDAEIATVDCAEYPCTAALRPARPTLDDAAHQAEMERLVAAVRACAPLRRAFAVGEGQDDALDVFRLDAPCGDRHERFLALMAIDTRGEAYAKQLADGDDLVEREVMRWMYRRGDDLVGLWPCDDAP